MGKRLLFSALILVLTLGPASAYGSTLALKSMERIESFSARISILPEGGVEVTETIVLISHADIIPWGIQRTLPRWQTGAQGIEYAAGVEIIQVLRDGIPEEYKLRDSEQGLIMDLGDMDSPLTPGRYVYTITYRSHRQVQFLHGQESVAWNVTGNWPIPIERVAVSMEFARAPRPRFDDWTASVGKPGQSGQDWEGGQDQEGWLQLKTGRPLEPGEVMTVWAAWPRGYSFPPISGGRILAMDSVVTMDSQRELTVREDITLYNDGLFDQGFLRDFTGLYADGKGKRRIADLDIHTVLLNGVRIPWNLRPLSTGVQLVVGDSEHPIPPGNSKLTIQYALDRQVAFGEGFEELRLTIPGYSSSFLVDQAKVAIVLPGNIPREELLVAGITRTTGGAGSEVIHYIDAKGRIVFATTRHLEPGENMISAVAWPGGFLEPVPWKQHLFWTVRDNASAAAALVVMVVLLLWYIPIWSKVGRRPLGPVQPVLSPPDELSPAALRFLHRGAYDNRTFTAGVLSLAVKGCLMVVEEVGKYALVSSGVSPAHLPPDEAVLIDSLFSSRRAVFPAKHRELINSARKAHRQQLVGMVRGKLLRSNRVWLYPAAVISVAVAALSGLLLPISVWTVVSMAGFALWCSILALVAVRTWDLAPGFADDRGLGAVVLVLVFEVLAAGTISIVWGRWLAELIDWPTVAALVGVVTVNAVFSRLLPAPTPKGREILKQAKGFSIWLSSLDEGRPGGPSRFEKFLPYAVALDVASKWGRRFGLPKRKGSFSPRWYQGSRWHTINAETLAASLSMLPRSKQDGIK